MSLCANPMHKHQGYPFAGGLAWDAIDGVKPATIDELVDLLWARYGEHILAGEFSFNDGEWHPFWPGEIAALGGSPGDES